jgi:hypothetical protein
MREVGLADNANRPKIEFVASSGVRRPDRNRLFTGQVEEASTKKNTHSTTPNECGEEETVPGQLPFYHSVRRSIIIRSREDARTKTNRSQ